MSFAVIELDVRPTLGHYVHDDTIPAGINLKFKGAFAVKPLFEFCRTPISRLLVAFNKEKKVPCTLGL